MDLADLVNFTPEYLDSLSLTQRNQFRDRLKELQNLERMTPKQRKKYLEKKKREAEKLEKVSDLQDTLKNLEELANPLYMKMKKKAEGSVLSGKGTLGKFDDVNVYIHCHNCKNTNEVREDQTQPVCAFCGTSLETR
jgi:Zn finger protein HypA/HybF involved in hydrogenase expression